MSLDGDETEKQYEGEGGSESESGSESENVTPSTLQTSPGQACMYNRLFRRLDISLRQV